MKVVLFQARTRDEIDQAEYERTFGRMVEIVSAMPGFRGIEGFAGEDGRELAVAWFDSAETVEEWKHQPEHVIAQGRGRTEFFSAYEITVAEVERQYGWPTNTATTSSQQNH